MVGAIALQGVRLCNPTFGETVVVIGLGLIGLLSWQFLMANGCRVRGIDIAAENLRLAAGWGVGFWAEQMMDALSSTGP